jgi:hypothetical protein
MPLHVSRNDREEQCEDEGAEHDGRELDTVFGVGGVLEIGGGSDGRLRSARRLHSQVFRKATASVLNDRLISLVHLATSMIFSMKVGAHRHWGNVAPAVSAAYTSWYECLAQSLHYSLWTREIADHPETWNRLERGYSLASQGGHNPRLSETGRPRRPERVLHRALRASVSDRPGVPPAGHDMGLRLSRRRDAE